MLVRLKSYLLVYFLVLLSLPSLALAFPQVMSYQGKLSDSGGHPVSGIHTMVFSIYDAPTGGNVLWTETWTGAQSVNVSNGIFNVELGSVQSISDAVFLKDTLYLGIKVNADNEMIPRQRVTSGTFAFRSKTTETVPVGTIMAWAKNIKAGLALPSDWVECNGQVLTDQASPLNGTTIPDLNGQERFLKGGATSGTIGGSASHAHTISVGRNYYQFTYGSSGRYPLEQVGGTTNGEGRTYEVDGRPPYYGVVWIMKVK